MFLVYKKCKKCEKRSGECNILLIVKIYRKMGIWSVMDNRGKGEVVLFNCFFFFKIFVNVILINFLLF